MDSLLLVSMIPVIVQLCVQELRIPLLLAKCPVKIIFRSFYGPRERPFLRKTLVCMCVPYLLVQTLVKKMYHMIIGLLCRPVCLSGVIHVLVSVVVVAVSLAVAVIVIVVIYILILEPPGH